jgi:hypothetical protein
VFRIGVAKLNRDVAKVDQDVAHVAIAMHIYLKCIFQMFHFVSNVCCKCFSNVAKVDLEVSCTASVCFKCSRCFIRLLQVSSECCICL